MSYGNRLLVSALMVFSAVAVEAGMFGWAVFFGLGAITTAIIDSRKG